MSAPAPGEVWTDRQSLAVKVVAVDDRMVTFTAPDSHAPSVTATYTMPTVLFVGRYQPPTIPCPICGDPTDDVEGCETCWTKADNREEL